MYIVCTYYINTLIYLHLFDIVFVGYLNIRPVVVRSLEKTFKLY